MSKNYKKYIFVLLTVGLMGQLAFADLIQISITGTAESTTMGYTSGQSYTFNWVVNDGYTAGSGDDYFDSTDNYWASEQTSDPVLWASISGDGLVGTYSRPSGNPEDPYDSLESVNDDDIDIFYLLASNDNNEDTSNLGLTVNGRDLLEISATDIDIGVNLDFPGTYSNPADYWATYAGTYTPEPGGSVLIYDKTWAGIYFTATGITIQAIPEPATLTFIGLFGGGLIVFRRIFML